MKNTLMKKMTSLIAESVINNTKAVRLRVAESLVKRGGKALFNTKVENMKLKYELYKLKKLL